jgi:hypothetical protein
MLSHFDCSFLHTTAARRLLLLSSCIDAACRPWPMSYRLVECFSLHKEDGPRFKVQLREWAPDWVQAGERAGRCTCCATVRYCTNY